MYYFECQCVWLIHAQYFMGEADQAVLSNVQGGAPKAAEPSVGDERREATLVEFNKKTCK